MRESLQLFSNSFTYCQAEQIKKGESLCPNVLARTHGIYLFKVEQFHLYSCITVLVTVMIRVLILSALRIF